MGLAVHVVKLFTSKLKAKLIMIMTLDFDYFLGYFYEILHI